ncbi:MAG: acyl-CoA synthetase [Zoogloea sp.]|nr:acyl-CoA synthetase [Zoogloea sp.]
MSSRLPLLTHAAPDSVVAWRAGRPVTRSRFLADVRRVAALLPAGQNLLNTCSDRYHFAVGLAAGMEAGKVSLLPSTYTPEVVRQVLELAPDTCQIADSLPPDCALPCLAYPESAAEPAGEDLDVPHIEAERLVAWVFTSGSTGMPVPHRKTWGRLVANVRAGAEVLGLDPARPASLVGTVPPQHMYGFESTVLLALQSGAAFSAARPFFPADICAELAAVPRPRVLVSTPFHLRNLLAAEEELPALDLLLSATAPLSQSLAAEAEARTGARLMEIYGSTETGQVASRRTAEGAAWTLFPGVRLDWQDGAAWASGGHIEQPVAMSDVLEPVGEGRFMLCGRSADLVNIAGKRTSLAWLNHQLAAIDGVQDGAFHMPSDAPPDSIVRLAACVVAPGLDAATLVAELRRRIDPVFLPRPLVFVEALPRNATGKLTHEAAEALFKAHAGRHLDRHA